MDRRAFMRTLIGAAVAAAPSITVFKARSVGPSSSMLFGKELADVTYNNWVSGPPLNVESLREALALFELMRAGRPVRIDDASARIL